MPKHGQKNMDKTCSCTGNNRFKTPYRQTLEIIKAIKNVDKVELLPYHTLGVSKYSELGIEYRLKDTESMDNNKCNELQKYLNDKLCGL